MTSTDLANAVYWQKNATYKKNFAKSIGYKDKNLGTIEKVIDLENRTIIGNNHPIIFKREENSGSIEEDTIALSADGAFVANSIKLNDSLVLSSPSSSVLEATNSNQTKKCVFELKSIDDFEGLTESQKESCRNIATVGDLLSLKNKTKTNKERLICVLDLLKYVPELADKVQEINELIDSLNNEVDG